ncbi:MAG: hypothetical protein MI723_13955, partial [Caulobacterales bacterium]|nr:hypothetical protein [Caulobacterales bacterium]
MILAGASWLAAVCLSAPLAAQDAMEAGVEPADAAAVQEPPVAAEQAPAEEAVDAAADNAAP